MNPQIFSLELFASIYNMQGCFSSGKHFSFSLKRPKRILLLTPVLTEDIMNSKGRCCVLRFQLRSLFYSLISVSDLNLGQGHTAVAPIWENQPLVAREKSCLWMLQMIFSLQILSVPWRLWRDYKPNWKREERPPHRRNSPYWRLSCRAPCSIIYLAYSKLSGSPQQRYSTGLSVWVFGVYRM